MFFCIKLFWVASVYSESFFLLSRAVDIYTLSYITAEYAMSAEKDEEDNSLCPLRTRRFFIDITYKFRYTVISHYPKPHTIHIPHHATGAGNYIGVLNLFLNRLSESRLDILMKSVKAEEV